MDKELTLIEKARKARVIYQREYRAKHAQRIREREIEYWAKRYDIGAKQ